MSVADLRLRIINAGVSFKIAIPGEVCSTAKVNIYKDDDNQELSGSIDLPILSFQADPAYCGGCGNCKDFEIPADRTCQVSHKLFHVINNGKALLECPWRI